MYFPNLSCKIISPSINELTHKEGIDHNGEFINDMSVIQQMYNKWKALGLKNEDARFVLPNACYTSIIMSGNFRQIRHVITMRADKHAQWEIRNAILEVLQIMYNNAPHTFEDLKLKFIG